MFDLTHAVYSVKAIAAIPLIEEEARIALTNISARRASASIFRSTPASEEPDVEISGLRSVKFAEQDQVKVMTPPETKTAQIPVQGSENDDDLNSILSSQPGSPFASTDSLPNTSPIIRTLVERLSFWSRSYSKPAEQPLEAFDGETPTAAQETAIPLEFGDLSHLGVSEPDMVLSSIIRSAPQPGTPEGCASELEAKVVRQTIREFSKPRGMYFAYTFDISRSMQHKQELVAKVRRQLFREPGSALNPSDSDGFIDPLEEPYPALPLWRRCDQQFIWNEWLSKPFADAGLHAYVLPLMQGYFQVASFGIPRTPEASEIGQEAPVDYIMISRRSKDRAGLRYQRRGVDDDANVANFVETECIMRVEVRFLFSDLYVSFKPT